MYAFLDPMWARCLFILIVSIFLYLQLTLDKGWSLIHDILALFLFCVSISAFVGFIAFLLKGI